MSTEWIMFWISLVVIGLAVAIPRYLLHRQIKRDLKGRS